MREEEEGRVRAVEVVMMKCRRVEYDCQVERKKIVVRCLDGKGIGLGTDGWLQRHTFGWFRGRKWLKGPELCNSVRFLAGVFAVKTGVIIWRVWCDGSEGRAQQQGKITYISTPPKIFSGHRKVKLPQFLTLPNFFPGGFFFC